MKPDLASRASIQHLVDAFYRRVRADDVIGFVFNEVAATDWEHHLPRMYDFWESVLFQKGTFRGNPLAIHGALAQRTPMGREQFERWLTLFCATIDDHFAGPNADHLKNTAADMASVIHRRINALPDTPEFVRPMRVEGSDSPASCNRRFR